MRRGASFEAEVRRCNEAFYRAFRDRDLDAMERLWAQHVKVACVHPGMDAMIGRAAVLEGFRGIFAHPDAPRLECSRVEVHVLSQSRGAAFVTCLEGAVDAAPTLITTNVFVVEEGDARIAHHQAGPLGSALRRSAARLPVPKRSMN